MPILIVLNGPPGIGKSTLARRYVDDHPLSLALEQDVVRGLIGGWAVVSENESGLLARELCLAMARTHLIGGHDVIVPQLIAVPGYLDRLASVAEEVGVGYMELVLLDGPAAAERRFHDRINDPLWAEHQRVAAEFIAKAGGYQDQYERLIRKVGGRPAAHVCSVEGDIDGTYAALLRLLPRPAGYVPFWSARQKRRPAELPSSRGEVEGRLCSLVTGQARTLFALQRLRR